MRWSKNAMSSGQRSRTSVSTVLMKSSPSRTLSERSAKAISGSHMRNSAAWREVLLFSARKVGAKVYTS